MKNLNAIKERYLKEPFNLRLGHLASDLARISSLSERPENIVVVADILEESKFFIEWTASEAHFDAKVLLAEMQIKLALWQRHILKHKKIKELGNITRNWSNQLLGISGLTA